MNRPEETNAGPVIRDLRRIDPRTGQVRNPGPAGSDASGTAARGPGKPTRPGRHAVSKPGGAADGNGPEAAAAGAPGPGQQHGTGSAAQAEPGPGGTTGPASPQGSERELTNLLAERTADLQRLSAEYANYRKRVDRDRLAVREQALANVLTALLPVLDDIGRAREHGELVGGFKSVAESLESAVTKLGLGSFGTEGEPFDPNVHEALTHSYSTDVTEPTCVQILQPGYKIGERILRPARVAVAEPDDSAEPGLASGETGAAVIGPDGGSHQAGETRGGPASQESREDDD
jgi:molecular chaperone GrpE